MKTFPIKDSANFFRQEILDITKNIFIRIYHLENGYGFRFVTFKEGVTYDPISDSDNLNWVYGPIKRPGELRSEAFDLYRTLNQK